jgi:hypothetical protein
MSVRVNSLVRTIFGSIFISLASLAVDFESPAMAGGACIAKPPSPAAEGMPSNVPRNDAICRSCYFTTEVLVWDVRYDRAKGLTCWFLRDAYGRDVTEAHVRVTAAPAPPPTLSSKLASWLGNFNFMRAQANAAPEDNAAHVTSPDPPRPHQGDTVNVKKTDSSARIGQKKNGEAHAAKQVSQASNRREEPALFEEFDEFMRWRERQKRFGN